MPKFIEFTSTNGKPVLFNVDNIVRVEPHANDIDKALIFSISALDDYEAVAHSYTYVTGDLLNA